MKVYDFYNEKYGIKLKLILDEDREELMYQCFTISDKYRGDLRYEFHNNWSMESLAVPAIYEAPFENRTLYLCGDNKKYDDNIIIINVNRLRIICNDGRTNDWRTDIIYKDIKQLYHELVKALDELNDKNDAMMFLDMWGIDGKI